MEQNPPTNMSRIFILKALVCGADAYESPVFHSTPLSFGKAPPPELFLPRGGSRRRLGQGPRPQRPSLEKEPTRAIRLNPAPPFLSSSPFFALEPVALPLPLLPHSLVAYYFYSTLLVYRPLPHTPLTVQLPGKYSQAHVGGEAEGGQQGHAVAGRAKPLGGAVAGGDGAEELAVALVAAVHGHDHDGGAVGREEGAGGVELGREDLEDDEGEGELGEGGAHVGAFKGALGGADLD